MSIPSIKYALSVLLIAAASSVSGQSITINPDMGAAADTADVETEQSKRAHTDELYFDALKARRNGDDRHAEDLLKQFLVKRPESATAHYELSKIYNEQKKTAAAITNIKRAMALDAENKWYKETHATILISAGTYTEAADVYASLTKSEKQDVDYPGLASEYYERAGKLDKAIEYINIALQRNIDDEELMIRKMQLYLNMNNVEQAAAVVKQMIATDPRNGK